MRLNTGIIGAGAIVLCAMPMAAFAQASSRFYAGGSVGAFRVSADEVSGTSTAGGLLAGFRVTPWLDVEGEVARPMGPFTRSYGGDALSMSFAPQGSSAEERERQGIWLRYDKRRDVSLTFSGAAVFHPSLHARVTPAVIVGVTNHRVRNRTDYTPTRVGSGVDPNHTYARPHAESSTRTSGRAHHRRERGRRRDPPPLDRAGSSIRLWVDWGRDQQLAAVVRAGDLEFLSAAALALTDS